MAEFLSDLSDAWTIKREKDFSMTVVIPQDAFNTAVDALARKLRDWGNSQVSHDRLGGMGLSAV